MDVGKPPSEGRRCTSYSEAFSALWLFSPGFHSPHGPLVMLDFGKLNDSFLTGAAQSLLGGLKGAQTRAHLSHPARQCRKRELSHEICLF